MPLAQLATLAKEPGLGSGTFGCSLGHFLPPCPSAAQLSVLHIGSRCGDDMNVTGGDAPSVFVSKKVMCHLLIYKRNIENILKRAILNYFWLMLQYLFSCIRKDSFVEKKCIFH